MRGLLLKEYYMVKKYCRVYVLIIAVFIALSFVGSDSVVVSLYPAVMAGMIPITLLAYDEQSRWNIYCGTLPYTKGQIVSAKYLTGLCAQLTALLASGIALTVKMTSADTFRMDIYLFQMSVMLILSCVVTAFGLPFSFKLGVEKGRLVYVLAMAGVCSLGGASSIILIKFSSANGIKLELPSAGTLLVFCLIAIALYVFSWYLSICFYKKREDV